MPQVDPNTGVPTTDDPGLEDPEAAGGKGPGEVPDATPQGHEAKPGESAHISPQGKMVGEGDRQSIGETPT